MERARDGLVKIVSEAIRRAPAPEQPLLAWPMVCGPAVAARTRALAFAAGTLEVEVPDAAWRGQLSEFAPRYRELFRDALGPLVERIEFVVAGRKPKPVTSNARRSPSARSG